MLGSIVVFGVFLKVIGMLLSGLLLIIGASLGSGEFKLREIILLGIFLVIFTALIFVVGLKLPIPLCPDIEALCLAALGRAGEAEAAFRRAMSLAHHAAPAGSSERALTDVDRALSSRQR